MPPPAVYDRDGRPLLSWRVSLLPYIGDEELFGQFKLDEPWDSPHNIHLLPKIPTVYRPYRQAAAAADATFFRIFVGEGAAFEHRRSLVCPRDFPDGTSETFLVVEAGEAVPWTKPEELSWAPGSPLPRLGGICRDGTFRAAFVDGHVQCVGKAATEAAIRAAITCNGGERGAHLE
ncbi:hypothetical protein AYO44_15570 [Planctomycetaceae bacterium SCGC AG-212-F19]|nr:hypothetical protein AYO44_15570 [Planctomycetaceae bacterium SCGC AG-212-F19]